ncbi:MAG: tRNA uridine-5-carboxymethylaminomethyl(34) synthesis GTPase MnmE [Bacteroidota bacterium]
MVTSDTICALATPHGVGAIAVIRLSGDDAFAISEQVFCRKNGQPAAIAQLPSHTIHYGLIREGDLLIDEVLLSVFKAPHSYTGQDSVEISCHGSLFIQQQLLQLLVRKGARMANAGEFTLRAFLNQKMDLSQAEAVADLIASTSATSHEVAMQQMRGGFSNKIRVLRENLVNFASLIELELDFSEEDVEFADRNDLKQLILSIQKVIQRLIDSFEVGNVIKNGIPVAIIGKPNSGKSTLLNTLLEEDRAIVSEIPGTTRDTIEDEISIDGILFRFIDTAGIRDTSDVIESMGVSKTFEKMKQSAIVIYLFDTHEMSRSELSAAIEELKPKIGDAQLIIAGNKIDKEDLAYTQKEFSQFDGILFISAKDRTGVDQLKKRLVELFDSRTVNVTETIVTNVRHVEALRNTLSAINKVYEGLSKNISGELLATDIRNALHHLGLITGEITTDDLLSNIFSKFCIGK